MGPSGAETGVSLASAIAGELFMLAMVAGLVLWGRSVARRRESRAWWLASWMPVVGLVVQHVGIAFTVSGLIAAFAAVSEAPPESRSSRLADGIATAMWATAIGLTVSAVIYLGCVIAFAIGTLRAPPAKA